MSSASIFSNLKRDESGAWVATYGAYLLQSALQPIFSQDSEGYLEIEAFEGLIRPSLRGEQVRPAQFFPDVAREDVAMIDSLCRTLHIFNTGNLRRSKAKLFVNFKPGVFVTLTEIRREVENMRLATEQAGLTTDRIVCEITPKRDDREDMLALFVRDLRQHGFQIAIDEYGAEESDRERLALMQPDFVKFEAGWVKEFLEHSAGSALLRVMVSQFREQGILAIFEGLEDYRQIDICGDLDVPLLQGYALARPQIAPTTFNEEFPDRGGLAPAPTADEALEPYNPSVHMPRSTGYSAPPSSFRRNATAFGKRSR